MNPESPSQEAEVQTPVASAVEETIVATKPDIQAYDFRNPILLSGSVLRKLRLHQQDFAESVASRLSLHLRLEFSVTLSSIQTVAYPKFAETWERPSHLTLFKLEPARGVSVLEISSKLGFAMVDRLMGGPGAVPATDQEFSEIEKALLEQTTQVFLEEWCSHWVSVKDLKPAHLGYESNGRFIQTIPAETVLLVISMEAGFGECKGKIQLGVPFLLMEPLIQRFCQGGETVTAQPAAPAPAPSSFKWNTSFNDVRVPVTAEWDGMEMTARDILALKVGDVLPFDAERMQKVNVRVADTLKFQGRPGQLAGQWAVELTEKLEN